MSAQGKGEIMTDPKTAAEDIATHLQLVEPATQINWGFTGTRRPITAAQWRWLNNMISTSGAIHEVHHGACINADEQFHFLAIMAHVPNIYVHPPINQRFKIGRASCRERV